MKICIECGRQLFDYDKLCDKCHSKKIVPEKEYKKMENEINSANIIKKKRLLQNDDYKHIYNRLKQPQKTYQKPIILYDNNLTQQETVEDYLDRVNKHTINNNAFINPTVTCPYCQSDDTKKITATSKAINTAIFGIFGTKRHKQWHCNRCGSDF